MAELALEHEQHSSYSTRRQFVNKEMGKHMIRTPSTAHNGTQHKASVNKVEKQIDSDKL